jgi:hypothetical protein
MTQQTCPGVQLVVPDNPYGYRWTCARDDDGVSFSSRAR